MIKYGCLLIAIGFLIGACPHVAIGFLMVGCLFG